jgi:hypothetical protein
MDWAKITCKKGEPEREGLTEKLSIHLEFPAIYVGAHSEFGI